MCDARPYGTTTIRPEFRLKALIAKDLGIDLAPEALRMFIRHNWITLKTLAHEIHGE